MPGYSMLYRCYVRRLSSATQEGSGASSLNITEVRGVKVVVAMDHTHLRYACSSCDVGRTQYSTNMLCMPLALCKAPIADCRELA